jgi:osmotically-inducible protein OsmY
MLLTGLLLLSACSSSDRQKLHEKTSKMAHEAKQQAHEVADEIKTNDTTQAREKLRNGAQDLKKAGAEASVKLDRAALQAKVKARLAQDLGAATLTNISVASSGDEVTLTGHVASEDQKQAAQNSAAAVPGVIKVHNEIGVQP